MVDAAGLQLKTVGDLLTRDLTRKVEEIIQVDQADERSVYTEFRNTLRPTALESNIKIC